MRSFLLFSASFFLANFAPLLAEEEATGQMDENALKASLEQKVASGNYRIISVADLKGFPELGKEESDCLSPIVRCEIGTLVPFEISIKGDLIALEPETVTLQLKVQKECYLAFTGNEMFISSDLTDWKSMRKFGSGTLSFGVKVDEEGLSTDFSLKFDAFKPKS